jgi:hypothetical protein
VQKLLQLILLEWLKKVALAALNDQIVVKAIDDGIKAIKYFFRQRIKPTVRWYLALGKHCLLQKLVPLMFLHL